MAVGRTATQVNVRYEDLGTDNTPFLHLSSTYRGRKPWVLLHMGYSERARNITGFTFMHYTYRNVDRNVTQQRGERNTALPEKKIIIWY